MNMGKKSFKGVYCHREKWQAKIKINGKNINLGRFTTQEEAAENYDFYVIKIYGLNAYINFPQKDYSNFVPKLDIFAPKVPKVNLEKRQGWGRRFNKIIAREIRAKHNNQKKSIKDLAKEYKTTFSTVSRILHNITYRDKDFSKVYVIHNPKVN